MKIHLPMDKPHDLYPNQQSLLSSASGQFRNFLADLIAAGHMPDMFLTPS
jgi:hypothetical protein